MNDMRNACKLIFIFALSIQTLIPSAPLQAAPAPAQIMEKAFDYFWKTSTTNALIAHRIGEPELLSTEGAGFLLTAFCLGAEREWIARTEASDATLRLLSQFSALPRFHGFWAEGCNLQTREPASLTPNAQPGAHTLATATLAAGLYTARAFFDRADNDAELEIRRCCEELLGGIEWTWMLSDSQGRRQPTLAAQWSPENGFKPDLRLTSHQDFRGVLAYLLALASTNHPVPISCWYDGWTASLEWNTTPGGTRFISSPALMHLLQPHVWIDFNHRQDRTADYFQSTRLAVRANYALAADVLYPGKSLWGITDCMGPSGYEPYGYPPLVGPVNRDAVLCPAAAIAAIPFAPEYSLDAIQAMYSAYSNELWGEYGFYESFSPKNDWFNRSYTTIHQGILLGMLANAKDGFVHRLFMSNPEIADALNRVGFTGVLDDFEEPAPGLAPTLTVQPSAAYSVRLTAESTAEGTGALQINYDKNEKQNAPLALLPALTDFSPYRYLAVWVKGRPELSFALEDENGKTTALKDVIRGPEFNEWRKHYYPLPAESPECRLSSIRRILVQAEPRHPEARGVFLLDHLHLANTPSIAAPKAPTLLQALPSRMPGELTLTWRQEEDPGALPVFRDHARYAHSLIRDERAFQRATPLPGTETRPLAASDLSCATRLPPSIHPYYIALRAEDISGARSDIVCSDPITLPDQTPPAEFSLEHFDEARPFIRWISPGPVLTAQRTTDASLEGSGCLEISYRKEAETDRWACLTAFPDIRDMSHYRYLSIWVAGRADFVLRFIDLHGDQQDTTLEHAINPNAWSPLFFDLSKLTEIDRSAIDRILVFVEPDKINIAGTVYVDSISLSNTRN